MKILSAVLVSLALIAPVSASAVTPRTTLSAVEAGVMCPTCGIPLAEANSPQSTREKVYVQSLIAQGDTLAQVKTALVAQYGPGVLSLPKDSGFNVAVYLVPIALALLLLISLCLAIPRWRKRSTEVLSDEDHLSVEDQQRLDSELARFG